jgi:hypothetical protein
MNVTCSTKNWSRRSFWIEPNRRHINPPGGSLFASEAGNRQNLDGIIAQQNEVAADNFAFFWVGLHNLPAGNPSGIFHIKGKKGSLIIQQ